MTSLPVTVSARDGVARFAGYRVFTLVSITVSYLLIGVGCGDINKADLPKSKAFTIAVDNQSLAPVKLRFDALQNGNCEKGRAKETIPSQTSRVIDVSFFGCVNGGGEKIDAVVYEFLSQDHPSKSSRESISGVITDGSKIVCADNACKLVSK